MRKFAFNRWPRLFSAPVTRVIPFGWAFVVASDGKTPVTDANGNPLIAPVNV